MKRVDVNPWTWQDAFGFSQAWRIEGAAAMIVVSGQASISDNGEVIHEGDFSAQARLTFENLKTVVEAAGGSLEDVVKLTTFVTDMSCLEEYGAVQGTFFPGKKPAQTLIEVKGLALPGMMIEVEALAVL